MEYLKNNLGESYEKLEKKLGNIYIRKS